MPSAVYLHDGEKQITVRFPTEEDRERFKAHYRAINALGMQWRDERDAAQAAAARLREALAAIAAGDVRVQRQWARDNGYPAVATEQRADAHWLARAALTAASADDGERDEEAGDGNG
jgi:hypothetical protein